ncbi:hypothetical protein A1O3_05239 [Capronia epimyces CBS 606.96]|uniref:ASTRA-associated protein 1 n=1 Tax=Capronia epimyces CBS 606.96 TaxID=1182542 RepID=W9Y4J8_9EURO|nr:uncharacterized protein A1O3_05239 [Capronia epimyces CBS 606.96]EXJ84570.1 hypothetical protein A1O3_05239 [Capronia epimyces CBS 606.96]
MEQGPAVPTYILRGHQSAIHALHFYHGNTFLASGDGDGWIVIWSLATKRPVAVWKGHDAGIMAFHHWTSERLVSHGRDHKLRVWQVQPEHLAGLSQTLPADGALPEQVQPWLLHSLSINALNFCAFSLCNEQQTAESELTSPASPTPQLIASPNGLDSSGIDIFQLPSEQRISQIRGENDMSSCMVMAVSLFHSHEDPSRLVLVSGYEDGRVMVHSHCGRLTLGESQWQKIMTSKPHSQPVLSIGVLPSRQHFVSSGADAVLAKFALTFVNIQGETPPEKSVNTKHAGQQGLSVRSDGKICATAGWDARIRIYSCKTMKELAVLKWHKVGCFATAFADVVPGMIMGSVALEPRATASPGTSPEVTSSLNALEVIKQQREEKARTTHWLAAGSKDGKISLWDIY